MSFEFAVKKDKTDIISKDRWKVLISDDEEDVHVITKLALGELVFENKGIDFFDAYNGIDTLEVLKQNPDIDLILLDVVMDSDDDGLLTVKKIREELNNSTVRIVLRTGQPGLAPQKDVILNYDIDDYKEKTELTSTKLFTTVVSSLRTSKHLKNIEKNRIGLSKIIDASKSIFKLSPLVQFTDGVLIQLGSILNISESSLYGSNISDGFFATLKKNDFEILATSGKFYDKKHENIITPKSLEYLNKAYLNKKSFFQDDVYVGYFHSSDIKRMIFLYIEGCRDLKDDDKKFLEVFSNNISIAFENICLSDESKQKDVLLLQQSKMATMGEMIENIAHQWRQPLSVITTSASGLMVQKEFENLTDKLFNENCDAIIKSAMHLSQTIDDFREFFKPDKVKSYFKLKYVVDKTLFLLSSKFKNRDIEVITTISDVEVYGLQNECIQVLINILNNSIDALENLNSGRKLILIDGGLKDEKVLWLSIKDNARGIAQEFINNVFEQYFTTKENEDGTGIGLYMVKQMIEQHMDGSIEVKNVKYDYEGQSYTGACFTIKIKK